MADGADPPALTVVCPAGRCRAVNDAGTEACSRCGTPLAGYARLTAHAATLFNRGLAAARAGDAATARDLFAAVVHWHPLDLEARNAHALACHAAGDLEAARRGWETVLERAPSDPHATRGLAMLAELPGD